jgi:L-glyceraldehyde 3-phosphate reductase
LGELGIGCIAFSPLAQGMLTSKYLNGVPADARATKGGSLSERQMTAANLERVRALNAIAERRGQSLAQMALAWVLRDERMTSALIGASKIEQIEQNVAAIQNLQFSGEELSRIDEILEQAAG